MSPVCVSFRLQLGNLSLVRQFRLTSRRLRRRCRRCSHQLAFARHGRVRRVTSAYQWIPARVHVSGPRRVLPSLFLCLFLVAFLVYLSTTFPGCLSSGTHWSDPRHRSGAPVFLPTPVHRTPVDWTLVSRALAHCVSDLNPLGCVVALSHFVREHVTPHILSCRAAQSGLDRTCDLVVSQFPPAPRPGISLLIIAPVLTFGSLIVSCQTQHARPTRPAYHRTP